MSLGEVDARALDVNVDVLRWVGFGCDECGGSGPVSGGEGGVGLIVPDRAQLLVGPDHGRLLPTAAVLGGLYLLAMDDVVCSLTDQEIPIGLLTNAAGVPIFAFLFWRTQARGGVAD